MQTTINIIKKQEKALTSAAVSDRYGADHLYVHIIKADVVNDTNLYILFLTTYTSFLLCEVDESWVMYWDSMPKCRQHFLFK